MPVQLSVHLLVIMAYPGARIVVLCCFLLHLSIVNLLAIIGWLAADDAKLCISFAQGIAYLFYPLVGLLADICFTRYKIIKVSVILQLVTSAIGVIAAFCLGNKMYLLSLP